MSDMVRDRFDEHPYGWVIVAVSTVCLALGFGAGGTVSVFIKPFEQEFGWLRADISMAYTMHTIGAAARRPRLGQPFGSDRRDERSPSLAPIAMAAGLAALRWQSDLWPLYLLYFLIGAVGFACLFTPVLALTGLWFNARKGLAIGIVTAGGAIGQGIVPYLAQLLITEFGWRDAALWLGAGYFVVLFPLMFLLRPAPSAGTGARSGPIGRTPIFGACRTRSPSRGSASPGCSAASAWPCRWCIWCRSASISDAARRPRRALLLSLMISGVFGRLFFGWLADRIGGLPAYFIASLAQTSVVFWFTQTKDIATLFQLSVLFGFGFAGVMTCLLICAREAAPLRMSGMAMAIVSTGGLDRNGAGQLSGRLFLRHHRELSVVLCERRNRRDPESAGRCGAVLVPEPSNSAPSDVAWTYLTAGSAAVLHFRATIIE